MRHVQRGPRGLQLLQLRLQRLLAQLASRQVAPLRRPDARLELQPVQHGHLRVVHDAHVVRVPLGSQLLHRLHSVVREDLGAEAIYVALWRRATYGS